MHYKPMNSRGRWHTLVAPMNENSFSPDRLGTPTFSDCDTSGISGANGRDNARVLVRCRRELNGAPHALASSCHNSAVARESASRRAPSMPDNFLPSRMCLRKENYGFRGQCLKNTSWCANGWYMESGRHQKLAAG